MKKNFEFKQKVCASLCHYYKPGKNEELTCRGYDIAKRIQQNSGTITFNTSYKKGEPPLVEALVTALCAACPFFAQDCDFMQDRSKNPCGGFILLIQNLESGSIMLTDINT